MATSQRRRESGRDGSDAEGAAELWRELVRGRGYPGTRRTWRNDDLDKVANIIRDIEDPVVDLQEVMEDRDPALLLTDGLNPSLEGQKVIVRSLVERLAGEERL
jgi:lysophospholipase L1-like esterase